MLVVHDAVSAGKGEPPFRSTAYKPIGLKGIGFSLCDPALRIGNGDIVSQEAALFPTQAEVDAIRARFAGCGFDSFKLELRERWTRFSASGKVDFLDPFVAGPEQSTLAAAHNDLSNITIADALTEQQLWRLIGAYNAYSSAVEYKKKTELWKANGPGAAAFGFGPSKETMARRQFADPTSADLARAEPVALGARNRAARAVLWQYAAMSQSPDFSLYQCARYGDAQLALGYSTYANVSPGGPKSAQDYLAVYNQLFRKLALPKLLASFGRIEDTSELVDEATGHYTPRVWQAVPNYECVKDASAYVTMAASNTLEAVRAANLQAERQAAEVEARRQATVRSAAKARNLRASSGNVAPVDDDILRAVLDARLASMAQNVARGAALTNRTANAHSINYETGIYWERLMGVQELIVRHSVSGTRCAKVAAAFATFECQFELKLDLAINVLGMSLPRLQGLNVGSREKVRFANGRWTIDGLADRYRRSRENSGGVSYDFSKGAKAFHCISSNNFADRFGLVRNIDC